jgi:hypothetical protein
LPDTIVIEERFHGPPGSGNGGYTCGLLAPFVREPAEVTLRRPPPLDRPLRVDCTDARAELFDGEHLVAEAAPAAVEPPELPEPPSFAEAERAAAAYPGFERHAFPTCFVCGPARAEGDGLRIFASPVAGREAVVAAPWTPRADVGRELVWAALDCPGAFAVGYPDRGETLLGRLAARIESVPRAGERCVVVAWPLGEEGRKLYAATALFSETGNAHAWARATWILPPPA